MTTLVKIIKGADFSGLNLGYVNLEPEITLTQTDLVFASRLKINLERSQPFNGNSNLSVRSGRSGFTYTNSSAKAVISATAEDNTHIDVSDTLISSNESATLIAAIKIPASMPSIPSPIMGYNRASGDYFGMISNSSGNILSLHGAGGSPVAAALPITDFDRWELVAAGRDVSTGKVWIYLPRKSQYIENDIVSFPAIPGIVRLLSDPDYQAYNAGVLGWEGSFSAMWRRSLSTTQINDVYASVKESLSFLDIEI